MAEMIRIVGVCLIAAVTAALLRRTSPETGLLLAAGAILIGGAMLLPVARGAAALEGELEELTGLAPETFAPLWKVTGIALVSGVGSAFCADAGQSALAQLMEAAGTVCALVCALPLLCSVLDLIRGWL